MESQLPDQRINLVWPSERPWSVGQEFALLNEISPVSRPGQAAFQQAHGSAASIENEVKNRYTDVLPNENQRVRLERDGQYINASHILPLAGPTRFICAQAPLPSTFYDFWRMIWEQERLLFLPSL